MKNKNFIYWIIVFFLVFTFCLSFINTNKKDNRKAFKSALLNPKYKNEIESFTLYDANNAIDINFNGNFWTISNPLNPENKLPADSQKIQNLIENLSTVKNMYKISDSYTEKNEFGLQDASTFHLVYYTKSDTSKYTNLIFGNHDFTQQYRYFLNGNFSSVYEIDTSLDSFLTSKITLWNEGTIISKNIIKNTDIQTIQITDFIENKNKTLKSGNDGFSEYSSKILELRQGGFPDLQDTLSEKIAAIKISFGNLDELILEVYASLRQGEYLLKETYNLHNSEIYEYTTKISEWTFSKLQ